MDLVFIIVAAHKPRSLTVPLYHKILPVSISAYAVSVSRTDVLAVTGCALVVFEIYSCEKCNGKNITGAQGPVQTVYFSFGEPNDTSGFCKDSLSFTPQESSGKNAKKLSEHRIFEGRVTRAGAGRAFGARATRGSWICPTRFEFRDCSAFFAIFLANFKKQSKIETTPRLGFVRRLNQFELVTA